MIIIFSTSNSRWLIRRVSLIYEVKIHLNYTSSKNLMLNPVRNFEHDQHQMVILRKQEVQNFRALACRIKIRSVNSLRKVTVYG